MTTRYVPSIKTWMRKRGDRVRITSGKYKGQRGIIESNVHQRTVEYPDRYADGFQVVLDSGVVAVVRAEQVV